MGLALGAAGIVVVNVTPVAHRAVLDVIGDGPIQEEVIGRDDLAGQRVRDVALGQRAVDFVQAILLVMDQGLGGIFAETVEEIGYEQETGAIMGGVIAGAAQPVGQVEIGVGKVDLVKIAVIDNR